MFQSLESDKEAFCVSNVCELWSVVLSAQTDKDKATLRQKMLQNTLNDCQPLLQNNSTAFHPSVLHLLHSVCVSKSVCCALPYFVWNDFSIFAFFCYLLSWIINPRGNLITRTREWTGTNIDYTGFPLLLSSILETVIKISK